MRIKESLQLDTVIRDRAHSLFLENDHAKLEKKARCLVALMDCRAEMDEIMKGEEPETPPVTNVGDINVTLSGGRGNSGPTKQPYQPFDGGDLAGATGREVARELKKRFVGKG